MSMQRVVIVGASVAGLSAADTLRDEGFGGDIIVLDAEDTSPYNKPPLSKEALTRGVANLGEDLLLRPQDHFAEMNIDLRTGYSATALDPQAHRLMTTKGPLLYDRLIIATGCRARTLETTDGQPLRVVRTLEDAQNLRRDAEHAASAVIIGSGFIGLEVASSLRQMGLEVTVIGNTKVPLGHCIGPEIAAWLKAVHISEGVRIINGVTSIIISRSGSQFDVKLADGQVVRADIAVAGVGVLPNVEWLEGSGVSVADGIMCTASGQTSVPDVWAAGDVAFYANTSGIGRVEHWTNAVEQGFHVAMNILNETQDAFVALPYAWSDQFGIKLQTFGRFRPGDQTLFVEGELEDDNFVALHGQGGVLNAITALGSPPSLRKYRNLLKQNAPWDHAVSGRAKAEA